MQVLNLDKLAAKDGRELVLFGQTHAVLPMTVGNFIETTRAAEKLATASIADQIEATAEMIVRSVPTLNKVELMTLSLEKLQVVIAFVRGDAMEGAEGVETAEGGSGN